MSPNTKVLYANAYRKYKKFHLRYKKSISTGLFSRYSQKKQRLILERIAKLKRRLEDLKLQLKLGVAAGALSIMTSVGSAQAQQIGPFVREDSKNPLSSPLRSFNVGSPAIVDIDGDGDLDVFVGNRFGRIDFLRNDGNPDSPEYTSVFGTVNPLDGIDQGHFATPHFADLDGDDDFDLILGDSTQTTNNVFYFENTGDKTNPVFETSPTTGIVDNISSDKYNAHPVFVDIDNDGDLDIVVGTNGALSLWKNSDADDGIIGNNPAFSKEPDTSNPLNFGTDIIGSIAAPDFRDLDDDGDLDLILGGENGEIKYFQNDGPVSNPAFTQLTGSSNPFDGLYFGEKSSPEFGDLDDDGDLDMFVGTDLSRPLSYAENVGTASNPVFQPQLGPVGGIFVNHRSAPEFADLDNDGDMDLIIGGKYSFARGSGFLRYYENIGNQKFLEKRDSDNPFNDLTDSNYQVPELVDIDDDDDLDLLLGLENDLVLYLNEGTPESPQFNATFSNEFTLPSSVTRFAPTVSKVDEDDDYDVVVGHSQITLDNLIYYRNEGDPTTSNFVQETSPGTFDFGNVSNFPVPEFVDIDHDGEDEIFVGLSGGDFRFYEKNGLESFTALFSVDNPLNAQDAGSDANPAFADLDEDGDLDAFVGEYNGNIIFYENQNDPPEVFSNLNMPISYEEGSAPVKLDTDLSISDRDNDVIIEAQFIISNNFQPGADVLGFDPGTTGINGDYDADNGILFLFGSANIGDYEDVLRSVSFENTSDNPGASTRTIEIFAIDFDNTNPEVTAVIDVDVIPVNDPPSITVNRDIIIFTEGGPAVNIAPEALVEDPDDATLTNAIVRITENFASGQDQLDFTDQNGITGNYNLFTGELRLNGTASVEEYQAALRSVAFRNTSSVPSPGIRQITYVVSDGTATSSVETKSLDIQEANTRPFLSSDNFGTSVNYNTGEAPVTIDSDLSVIDNDSENMAQLTVSIQEYVTGDSLDVDVPVGMTKNFDTGTGILTIAGSRDQSVYSSIASSVTFKTSNGTSSRLIEFVVNDGDLNSDPYSRSISIEGTPVGEIEVFNAISPNNGDDKNDFLEIAGITDPNQVKIYNRWGDLVYETDNYDNVTNRFEGISDGGEELPSGTYFYKINTDTQELTGYLVIKK